jgi:hypothetical protein
VASNDRINRRGRARIGAAVVCLTMALLLLYVRLQGETRINPLSILILLVVGVVPLVLQYIDANTRSKTDF